MKEREIYADIKALPPLIVRADGRNFKKLLANFEKPYDKRFAESMVKATEMFFENSGFHPKIAYIFSDEISLFFEEVPFKGRIEKLDSVIASFLASALTITLGLEKPIAFDARVIPLPKTLLIDYLAWRQAEAWRNHVNAYCYYTLRKEGLSEREAEEKMRGMKVRDVHEMLFSKGINLNETPKWQRRGILVGRLPYKKEGYNPKAAEEVVTTRYKLIQIWDLPLFKSEEGKEIVYKFVEGKSNAK
ncbi:MAG: tRNA(His) guanylyltransferase Thg1 family protein [Candidatus Methanospirareceae archaeon]